MNEMEMKLEKIRKSAGAGEKACRILLIICIVAFTLTLISGISVLAMGDKFDEKLDEANITEEQEDEIMSAKMFSISIGEIRDIHSDIPALRNAIDDHPMSVACGVFMLLVSFSVLVMCVVFKVVGDTFGLIKTEPSPFTDRIRKRVLVVMIIFTVLLASALGGGFALLGAFVTWLVYTILDYGKTLQVQADETL